MRSYILVLGFIAFMLSGCGGGSSSTPAAATTYTIGGAVSGLASGTSFTIQNNGTDSQLISSNGAYTFATALANGTSYVVSVSNQPTLQYCVVTNGSGTLAGSNIINANIACTAGVNESVLYSFGTGTDGQDPYAGLIQDASGNLYGTTYYGGTNRTGTVFKVTPDGVETVLHSFGTGTDGQYPYAGLIQDASGNLYGTTQQGGTNGTGTVFKVTPAGVETVLYSFGIAPDGYYPNAGLIQDASGNLYGTTYYGGTNNKGTVFKVTPAGVETVLYSFGIAPDGYYPSARLIQDASGNLYGTTTQGGTNTTGTVFKISPR